MSGPAMPKDEQGAGPRRRPLVERGWRYTLVGLICAIAHNAIMIAVDRLGGHYLLGILVSFVTVTPIGYALHSRFTFAQPLRLNAFTRFVGGVVAAYPISVAMMVVLCSGFGLSVAVATPIATIALFVWNFAAAHWAILPRLYLLTSAVRLRNEE
ncbi:MAG: GtrA family protein [Mesorhizobium sp.]|uniref:GtrA family protein n=2 Tax=unclassified Mesorhizobium TaxID=325217 RepID=UPI000F764B5B|nr:GtrA family protein [Mesorhizobium sp. M2A.F.Ca.ET.046.03.2.1]RVC66673.1 GtrA family protein [Mesorhizobium sp. M00.F.Ca.ET.038.03.1.1]RWA93692.1 MAG: GtrA family protein [Mesorhizobium sp.]RWB48573.1 MAG: GtrA family protein [Mesorhizobium sp.]RWE90257.1 MAG: GtrA family protein [Mesorhizobium sp.]